MLLAPLIVHHPQWIIAVVAQIIGYFFILRKMNLDARFAIIPFAAEGRLSKELFRRMRSYFRPLVIALVFILFGLYLNPFEGTSRVTARIFFYVALLVYGAFLARLYYRLCKAFGKGILFTLLICVLPPLGMIILSLGKSTYTPPTFKPERKLPVVLRFLSRAGLVLVSVAEVAALVAGVGFITVRTRPPRFLASQILSDTYAKTKDVTGTGEVVTREQTMGEAYANLATMPTSREKFFPNHDQDKSVVVMAYIIGADLEDKIGLSSANITQMIDATKQGDGLTFVLECGGSGRWFTRGIADNSYGRYVIHNGELEKVLDLDSNISMSDPAQLADFINWARDNYPADRNMLVMWDHGGGLGVGYGIDIINKRATDTHTLMVDEICSAIAQSGMRFDVIGFDACLMQDINVAAALEPYADYYLASEEVEGGYGWPYTSAFGMLAKDPTASSEDFGHEMIACYDPYNTIIKDGEPDTTATLSFVDLPRAKAAYSLLEGFYGLADAAVRVDTTSFANVSLAGSKSYLFQNLTQIDLIDFLSKLDSMDFEDKIASHDEINNLINNVRASVVYRNANSAEGVHGMAVSFPYQDLSEYKYTYRQLNSFSFIPQRDLYSDFFSIMAAQQKKAADERAASGTESPTDILHAIFAVGDYTTEEWYVQGFENYESQQALVDIPLIEVANGYKIGLPDSAWPIIASSQVIVYQEAEDGTLRYLGLDNIGATDEAGHPMVAMDGSWIHVGGKLVCYEAGESRETEDGTVFTGTVKARLNGEDDVILRIEWDPVTGEEEPNAALEGRVVGYDLVDTGDILSLFTDGLDDETASAVGAKAQQQLQAGDRLEFLFDYYDEQGELVQTDTYGGTLVVVKDEMVKVTDEKMGESDIVFGGVLTDVYQRRMTTEKIEAHVS